MPHLRAPAHWQAILALLALVGIYSLVALQLSPRLSTVLALTMIIVIGSVVLARHRRLDRLNRTLAFVMMSLFTLALICSVALVIAQLVYSDGMEWMAHRPSPAGLLATAALIWLSNVLVFGAWYWELDAGGPTQRHSGPYRSDDLVFPQRQRDGAYEDWMPDFLDYLFLAFNSSTAFSPTDTLILSRRMKWVMMCQSLISLAVLAVLAARAVNALA